MNECEQSKRHLTRWQRSITKIGIAKAEFLHFLSHLHVPTAISGVQANHTRLGQIVACETTSIRVGYFVHEPYGLLSFRFGLRLDHFVGHPAFAIARFSRMLSEIEMTQTGELARFSEAFLVRFQGIAPPALERRLTKTTELTIDYNCLHPNHSDEDENHNHRISRHKCIVTWMTTNVC